MSEQIAPRQFHEVGWRIVRNDACAHFRTESFAAGVALVEPIGRLADAADQRPRVDLRYDGVTVRLPSTASDHFLWLSESDLQLARQISAAARELASSSTRPACRSSRS